jgi:hypothetical protein
MQESKDKTNKVIESLLHFFKQKPEETKDKVPDGLCPNCWGWQEFDHKIRKMYDDKQIDVNSHSANYAFIQDFVVNQVNGIVLEKEENRLICPACRRRQNNPVS